MNRISPILKWAGGKRQLLPQLLNLIPADFDCYFEPFLGAGAVFLALEPKKAIVNDTNIELINVYRVIKENPEALIDLLKNYERSHCPQFYYSIRNLDRDIESFSQLSNLNKAARTIYLNRTCYNGLYRVNKSGFFNTPIGHNSSIQIVNERGIYGISRFLNESDVSFLMVDYKEALKGVSSSDFVFLDPPYYPLQQDSFLRYDSSYFGKKQQEELKRVFDELTYNGIKVIETNSDCTEIRDLYCDYNLIEVEVRRNINSIASGRRGKELIILNY